jgi:hypothetical protein
MTVDTLSNIPYTYTNGRAVVQKHRQKSSHGGELHLTSEQVIELEHKYGAHK